MGDYNPYHSGSPKPTEYPDWDLPDWAHPITEHFPVNSMQFLWVYRRGSEAAERGVNITTDVLHYIMIEVHDADEYERRRPERIQKARERPHVVYYMRIGDRVKVGTTANLDLRMANFNPEELLATEPGGYDVERERHQQFAHLRTHGEWFVYDAELKDHIDTLKTASVDDEETSCDNRVVPG